MPELRAAVEETLVLFGRAHAALERSLDAATVADMFQGLLIRVHGDSRRSKA